MSLVVNTNVSSLIAQQNLNTSQSSLQTALQRLSSGLRINSAADDAAGYAIANSMTSQINGLGQAQNNANDGISLVQTTSGALQQIDNNLQTIRQLTVEAANGTNGQTDDSYIQTEIKQDLAEINRVSQQTQFNGVNVLSSDNNINIQVGADDGQTISISLSKIDASTLGVSSLNVVPADEKATASNVVAAMASGDTATVTSSGGTSTTYTALADGKFSNGSGTVVTGSSLAADMNAKSAATSVTIAADSGTTGAITVSGTGSSATITAAKAGSGNSAKTVYVGGNGSLNASAQTAATSKPLTLLDAAINQVSKLSANLGAIQNRLTSAVSDIQTANTNLQSSRSAIQDTNYASEVSKMTQEQILQQAGTSVLSQANQTPQTVLSLLQNA